MTIKKTIRQLESLKEDAMSRFNDDGDDEVFRADVEVLDAAIAAIKQQQEQESNEPLTLDGLRQMKGEPVWITLAKESGRIPVPEQWTIFAGMSEDINKNKVYVFSTTRTTLAYTSESYGQTWLTYRRKPKDTTEG